MDDANGLIAAGCVGSNLACCALMFASGNTMLGFALLGALAFSVFALLNITVWSGLRRRPSSRWRDGESCDG